jgi:hypothetical protein
MIGYDGAFRGQLSLLTINKKIMSYFHLSKTYSIKVKLFKSIFQFHSMKKLETILFTSVADPDPDPPDPHVLGLPDPDQDPIVRGMDPDPDRSFYHCAKIVRKTLISTIL